MNSLPRASHQNLFGYCVDLMQVPDIERLYPYSPSLFQPHGGASQPRFYIVGDTSAIYVAKSIAMTIEWVVL